MSRPRFHVSAHYHRHCRTFVGPTRTRSWHPSGKLADPHYEPLPTPEADKFSGLPVLRAWGVWKGETQFITNFTVHESRAAFSARKSRRIQSNEEGQGQGCSLLGCRVEFRVLCRRSVRSQGPRNLWFPPTEYPYFTPRHLTGGDDEKAR
ncbi:hypothetical protein LZ30DRAFT_274827 [Colletotrichum cereale]|nr:hypothetical protein LZ30DRAFT_274827 [Colletotrichum cereale]